MPKYDYIFVDESGDPGYTLDPSTGQLLSTPYYVVAALHICDDCFPAINTHIASFRYLTGMNRELKIPPEKDVFKRLIEPLSDLAIGGRNIWASVIYVDKERYTGRYLKPGGRRPPSPTMFRNRMLRCLLEFHFSLCSLQSRQFDLVLDRVEMAQYDAQNLQAYLAGNHHIPTPTHITHASSIYVEPLQIVHHIAAGYKDIMTGKNPPDVLGFVNARDVTLNQFIYPR